MHSPRVQFVPVHGNARTLSFMPIKTMTHFKLLIRLAILLGGSFLAIRGYADSLDSKPNILHIVMDNVGYGEPGVYGGGILRGASTPRIDKLAAEGLRLTNFNVEAQCTPSRSATMTGRYAIRSGTHSVPGGGALDGLTQWEVTIPELLSGQGYATAHFGKWHLGSTNGRLPNDQGFDLWYGIPRTTDEAFWPDDPFWHPGTGVEPEYVMWGEKGRGSRPLWIYDLEERRRIDALLTRQAIYFMKRTVQKRHPFYVYVPLTQVHYPTLPNRKFEGKTGYGDFPDALAEMDYHVGEMVDAIDRLGIRDNTIVVFTSDNGPEATYPYQGSSGPWRGYYYTHMEGSLRVPFIIRWPGKIAAGRVSDEMVHTTDLFATFAAIGGAEVPKDRPIDGVDQSDFLLGKQQTSNREALLAFVADRLEAVKWMKWKLALYEEERDWWSPVRSLVVPKLFNLITDPKEEYSEDTVEHTWVLYPMSDQITKFWESVKKCPLIPPGTPDPYKPPSTCKPPF